MTVIMAQTTNFFQGETEWMPALYCTFSSFSILIFLEGRTEQGPAVKQRHDHLALVIETR